MAYCTRKLIMTKADIIKARINFNGDTKKQRMKRKLSIFAMIPLLTMLVTSANAFSSENENWVRQAIGQKLMLDFRFFCSDKKTKNCRTPMTVLPKELKSLIQKHHIGGVILFSENLENIQQIKQLTADLQAANSSLFIGIDQEGGRVARLPRDVFPAFPGNMPLGATYTKHKTIYAEKSASAIAAQLSALGFNLNFAPNVDVNSNPRNPVINIRAFGDNAKMVAQMGAVQVKAYQDAGISAAIKHFPGHGDTHVDSHSGLPLVKSSIERINQQELFPFKTIITNQIQQPDFVMSAHIQFPALDDSTVVTKSGKVVVTPATLSKKIITDLLKTQLGFKGLVISDALDMGAVKKHFAAKDAIKMAFNAGIDIALIPMVVDSPEQITKLITLIDDLEKLVKQEEIDKQNLFVSHQKILRLKNQKRQETAKQKAFSITNTEWKALLDSHQSLSQTISDESLVFVKRAHEFKNEQASFHPMKLLAFMPDTGKCKALNNALAEFKLKPSTCMVQTDELDNESLTKIDYSQFNTLLVASITPKQSHYEMIGTEEAERLRYRKTSLAQMKSRQISVLKAAKENNINTIYVSLRMPYEMSAVSQYAENMVATFNYGLANEQSPNGAVFRSIAKMLSGKLNNDAKLPLQSLNK